MSSKLLKSLALVVCAGVCLPNIPLKGQSDRSAEINRMLEEIGRTPGTTTADRLGIYKGIIQEAVDTRDTLLHPEVVNAVIGVYIMQGHTDSVLQMYEQALEQARDWEHKGLMARYAIQHALTLQRIGNYHEAFTELQEVLATLDPYPRDKSLALQAIGGLSYHLFHHSDSALICLDSSIQIAHGILDSVRISSALEVRASVLRMQGRYFESIENTISALSYVQDRNALKKVLLLDHVSDIFKEIGQLDRALEYSQRALAFSEENNFKRATATSHISLGEIYFEMGKHDEAEEHFVVARNYFNQYPKALEYIHVNTRIAYAAILQGYPEAALSTLSAINTGHISNKSNYIIAGYYLTYGQALSRLGQYSEARQHVYESLAIAERMNDPRTLLPALKELRIVEAQLGNLSAALNASDRYVVVYDSTFQLRQSQLLFESESRYQRVEQDKAIAQLNADNAIKDLNLAVRDTQIRYGVIAILLFAALAIYIFFLYRQIRKAKQKVEVQNKTISKALDEKELLLKEIHHRVKNNLQVVSSLLSLQSRYIEDKHALEAIKQGRDRVKSMALIHQNLYQGEHLTGIEVRPYFEKVIGGLFNSYNISPERISMNLDVDDMILDVDTIIPIGLIVNELVTNALKYAFPGDRTGSVSIELRDTDDGLRLVVADNGVGMQGQWEETEASSFGYRLIHAFREKLDASLDLRNHTGTQVELNIQNYQKVK